MATAPTVVVLAPRLGMRPRAGQPRGPVPLQSGQRLAAAERERERERALTEPRADTAQGNTDTGRASQIQAKFQILTRVERNTDTGGEKHRHR